MGSKKNGGERGKKKYVRTTGGQDGERINKPENRRRGRLLFKKVVDGKGRRNSGLGEGTGRTVPTRFGHQTTQQRDGGMGGKKGNRGHAKRVGHTFGAGVVHAKNSGL